MPSELFLDFKEYVIAGSVDSPTNERSGNNLRTNAKLSPSAISKSAVSINAVNADPSSLNPVSQSRSCGDAGASTDLPIAVKSTDDVGYVFDHETGFNDG